MIHTHVHDEHYSEIYPIVKDLHLRRHNFVPAGVVNIFGGIHPPEGWLICNGDLVSKETYEYLYTIIGDAFGCGNSTHFRLPDMRTRFPLGINSGIPIGYRDGEETHVLTINEMPAHAHDIRDPGHTHSVNGCSGSILAVLGNGGPNQGNIYTGNSTTGIEVLNRGGGAAHNNMPPYVTFNYIIKY